MDRTPYYCRDVSNYEQLDWGRLSISKIASEHKVSWKFMQKIESELYINDWCVVSPEEITLDMVSWQRMGPGTIILDQSDCFALYCLYHRPQEADTILEEIRL